MVSRDKDKISDSRYEDMKGQYEARLREVSEDRDWFRDRLYQSVGLNETQNQTFDELVKRVARKLPPAGGR